MNPPSILAGFILIFLLPPIWISRLSNLAGQYRLVVMISLLVIFWSIITVGGAYFIAFPGDETFIVLMAVSQATTIVIVIPLVLISRILVRIIARRYAPSVADAIATVMIGGTASFATPIFGLYLFIINVDYQNITTSSSDVLPEGIGFPVFLIMAIFTSTSVWILMGWGSMATLRRRKGTVIGLVSVSMALFFSAILAGMISHIIEILSSESSDAEFAFALVVGSVSLGTLSIISGMLTAGLMSGILVGIASVFDLIAFFITAGLMLINLSYIFEIKPLAMSSFQILALITVLSIIQLRCFLIGNKVVSLLSLIFLSLPFIALATQIYSTTSILIIPIFISIALLLAQWGVALRSTRYGGLITTILLVAALIATPFIYVSL